MRIELSKDNVADTFKQKVIGSATVNNALEIVIDFYVNYEIKNVDSSIPDNDMLLFEYGIYDWQDGKGENFTIDITRQFYVESKESDGFSQLHLILYFDRAEFDSIEAANKWSIDFDSIDEWKNYVTNTEGFKLADGISSKAFDVFLTETD